MVTRPLIPDRTLRQLVDIANRSKRSTARIGRVIASKNDRGLTVYGDPVYDTAIPCRVDPMGIAGVADTERVRADQIVSVGYASIAVPLDTAAPAAHDVVEVTTVLPDGTTEVASFEVRAVPAFTSYSVEMTFPVVKIG